VAAAPAKPSVNYRVVVPIVAIVIFVGLLSASSLRRSDDGDEQAEVGSGAVAREGMTARASPDDLSDDEIRQLIEECGYFQENLTVRLPKSVLPGMMRWEDPRLILAVNMGLLELDPPFDASDAARYLPNPTNPGQASTVRLGPNSSVAISDLGDAFHVDLGRRRVEELKGVQRSADKIGLSYRWTVEEPTLLYLAPDHEELWGGAELRRTADGWKARVWRNTSRSALILCRPD
jgi:hypothetical protein